MRYNWAKAFTEFHNGATLEEVAATHDIPFETVKQRANEEQWKQIRLELQRADDMMPARTEARLKAIELNREENLRQAVALRDDVARILVKLQKDEWTIPSVVTVGKGKDAVQQVVERKASINDRLLLANYVRTIHDLTYRALGDVSGGKGDGTGVGPNPTAAPGITLILPGVIAKPRSEQGKPIDIEAVVQKVDDMTRRE